MRVHKVAMLLGAASIVSGCFPPSKFHAFDLAHDKHDVVWVVQAEELLRCWLEPWGPICMTAEKMSPEVLIKRRAQHERMMSPPPLAPVPELKPPTAPKPKPAPVAPPETSAGYDWTKK